MAKKKRKDDDDEDDKPKKKKKPVKAAVVEAEDDDLDDDAAIIAKAKKQSGENAYGGLLAITLIGFLAAAVLLYLDSSELSKKPLSPPSVSVPGLGSATAAPPIVPTPSPAP